jgi:hypothetical protein
MAMVERTAYLQFKRKLSVQELVAVYTPTRPEIEFVRAATRGEGSLLSLLVMLKSFQRLGYFPHREAVPTGVIGHIRSCLGLGLEVPASAPHTATRMPSGSISASGHTTTSRSISRCGLCMRRPRRWTTRRT